MILLVWPYVHKIILKFVGAIIFAASLKFIPPEVINATFFAKGLLRREDFFDSEGNFSFIDVDSRVADSDRNIAYQSQFMENFRHWIENDEHNGGASEDDLRKFLHFCTGQSVIPDLSVYKTFKISIEFNDEDDDMNDRGNLPISHSCTMDIKFPADAYGGQDENGNDISKAQQYTTFKAKMKQAFDYVGNNFTFE